MHEEDVLQTFNQALLNRGLPVLSELEFAHSNQVPLGTTGKVLKRELRRTEATL